MQLPLRIMILKFLLDLSMIAPEFRSIIDAGIDTSSIFVEKFALDAELDPV